MNTLNNPTNKNIMTITGLSLLLMAIASIWAYGIVFTSLYVPGDALKTFTNIESNGLKFALGNAAWIVILLTDLVVAWGLYHTLKQKNSNLALTTLVLRLIYSVFLAVGIGYLITKNLLGFLTVWHMGLIIFGLHLIILGLIRFLQGPAPASASLKIQDIPWWISAILILAGIGYLVVHGLNVFMPESAALAKTIEMIFILPMSISELLLAGWLIFKGRAAA